jgi:hypothetical protein
LYWTGWIEIWSGYMIKWGGGNFFSLTFKMVHSEAFLRSNRWSYTLVTIIWTVTSPRTSKAAKDICRFVKVEFLF